MRETTLEWLDRVALWKIAGVSKDKAKEMVEAAGFLEDYYTVSDDQKVSQDYQYFLKAWKFFYK
jgi:hypothetical protein